MEPRSPSRSLGGDGLGREGRDRDGRQPRGRCRHRGRARRGAAPGSGCAARATDAAPLSTPGTIDETVRRIVEAGGDAIAVPTNLASDEEVEAMVARVVDEYGGVDLLVNNAAITFPGDLDLDMKRFDLVIAGRPPRAAARHPRGDPGDGVARRWPDRQRVVGGGAQLLPGADGLRHGEGRPRAPHGLVGRAAARRSAIAVNTFRIDVPVASEGFVRNLPGVDHSDLGAVRGRGRGDLLDARASPPTTPATTSAWPSCAPSRGSWATPRPAPRRRGC